MENLFGSVCVLGGDLRQLTLANLLLKDGYDVTIFGFDNDIAANTLNQASDMEKALSCEIIILPVPVTFDGIYVNAPYCKSKILAEDVAYMINPLSLVFGGCISDTLRDIFNKRGIKHRDYMLRDELAIKNAVPTAEGAIQIAIAETPFTIHNSKCLVLGYGKVGKILAKSLSGLGAKTYVEARKYTDLALIEGNGYFPLTMNEAKSRLNEFDIIFNTVPAQIINFNELKKVKDDTLIIDLASKPGGIDFKSAKELGKHVIWALSLPGRIAPVTAGGIIKETITNMLAEEV